ncbi:hypothetical protein FHETE_11354 [Fusarium heterosporum]|uniref:Protein kinase domain-containing protein n=1 Tax=Fusarium heterosporum TaxID=42747 RepID=A0A8H5WD41_FUSHE|nr:hypothetical protein FHETE_11354 [Fusarium heterosporum]
MIALRRKRPFCRERQPVQRTTPSLYYWGRDPKVDYLPHHSADSSSRCWIAQHRSNTARKLVVIKELNYTRIADIEQLTAVTHPNIARPLSFYRTEDRLYVVHSFFHLEVLDLLPLWPHEISSIMKQFIKGLQYMTNSGVMFHIDAVQIGTDGVIKIVLDWNLEPHIVDSVQTANRAYILAYVQDMMRSMIDTSVDVPASAKDFVNSSILPSVDVSATTRDAGRELTVKSIHSYHVLVGQVSYEKQFSMLRRGNLWPRIDAAD